MPVSEGRWIRWLGNGLSVIVLLLAILITIASMQNRGLQDKVSAGRAALAKAQTLANLDNGLVQLLAKTAADKNDTALQGLLASNGITFRVEPNAGQTHPAPATPAPSSAPAAP